MRFACAIVVAAWFEQACSSQYCTSVGCANGVDIGLRTEAGTWPDGRYTVSFETPHQTHACSLQLPVDLPVAPEWSKLLSCTKTGDSQRVAGRFAGSFQRYTACELPRGGRPDPG